MMPSSAKDESQGTLMPQNHKILSCIVGAVIAASGSARAANVLTEHNDNARSGANLNELRLKTSNVNVQRFGKLFERFVDGMIFGQPLDCLKRRARYTLQYSVRSRAKYIGGI
jgi:hypothetical protein